MVISSAHRGLDISNYLQLISISLLVLGVRICTAGIKSELAHPFIVVSITQMPSHSCSQCPPPKGKDLMWAAHRGRDWHSLEHWGCWQCWWRCSLLRQLPQDPGRPPLHTGCPRNPGSGRSGVVVGEVEGMRRKVVVQVPPDRQHYPESPVGRKKQEWGRSESLSSQLANFHSIIYWAYRPTLQRPLSQKL